MMIPSPSPRPRPARELEDGAYNDAEHSILAMLRHKHADDDITSFEDLAARTGLPIDEVDRTMKKLLKRRTVFVAPMTDDGRPSPLVIKATRVEYPK